jgi:hypothetical protein
MDGATQTRASLCRTPSAWDEPWAQWQNMLEQARAFLPDDPMTACYRLRTLRREVQHALEGDAMMGERLDAFAGYLERLIARSEQAKREWLAACTERERQFHLHKRTGPRRVSTSRASRSPRAAGS